MENPKTPRRGEILMKAKEYSGRLAALKTGKRCLCGDRAVDFKNGGWTCQQCIDRDRAVYGTDRIRSTCGFAGALDCFRSIEP